MPSTGVEYQRLLFQAFRLIREFIPELQPVNYGLVAGWLVPRQQLPEVAKSPHQDSQHHDENAQAADGYDEQNLPA